MYQAINDKKGRKGTFSFLVDDGSVVGFKNIFVTSLTFHLRIFRHYWAFFRSMRRLFINNWVFCSFESRSFKDPGVWHNSDNGSIFLEWSKILRGTEVRVRAFTSDGVVHVNVVRWHYLIHGAWFTWIDFPSSISFRHRRFKFLRYHYIYHSFVSHIICGR